MAKLRVTAVQSQIVWENREKNCKNLGLLLAPYAGKTDLVILPEMFSTGFTMEPDKMLSESRGQELSWMKDLADKLNSAVTGSYIAREQDGFRNRLAFVTPGRQAYFYDKRHLFRIGEENRHYSAGNRILDISWKGWLIKPLICYDLRFPVWIRSGQLADLIIFIANWPASRKDVWMTLLKARALENQAFTIGVNRVGTDGRDIEYSGNTVIFDPRGSMVASAPENEESVITAALDKDELILFRKKFPVHLDADRFQIIP